MVCISRLQSTMRVVCLITALAVVPVARAQQPVRPFVAMSASAEAMRDSIVSLAKAQLGKRYVRGGETPRRGFDCSGLVKYVLSVLNLEVPRTARQQANVGEAVDRDTSRLLPGDLLTFARPKKGVSHIGIYVGDGMMIHASVAAGRVIETPLIKPPSRKLKPWRGVRRLLADVDSSTLAIADTLR